MALGASEPLRSVSRHGTVMSLGVDRLYGPSNAAELLTYGRRVVASHGPRKRAGYRGAQMAPRSWPARATEGLSPGGRVGLEGDDLKFDIGVGRAWRRRVPDGGPVGDVAATVGGGVARDGRGPAHLGE